MRNPTSIILLILLCWLSSCKTFSKTQFGQALGLRTGTALGSVVGDAAGNEMAGTMIGGSLGAATGEAMVKSSLEKQADDISATVHDASVRKSAETLIIEFKTNNLFPKNGSTTLSEKAKDNLDKLITILNKYPASKIDISAFDKNKRGRTGLLSAKRAAMLGDYFRLNGVDPSRISLGTKESKSEGRVVSIVLS